MCTQIILVRITAQRAFMKKEKFWQRNIVNLGAHKANFTLVEMTHVFKLYVMSHNTNKPLKEWKITAHFCVIALMKHIYTKISLV